ncbi:MAG: RHH1 domain-containing protein [Nitrospira sp.]|nr:MAG: RHH1 domain-containing protein [Nitrospira sp.]
MTTVTVSLSNEEMRRPQELSKREGLTIEQVVRLGISNFIGQPDESFRAATKRVVEENAELCRLYPKLTLLAA